MELVATRSTWRARRGAERADRRDAATAKERFTRRRRHAPRRAGGSPRVASPRRRRGRCGRDQRQRGRRITGDDGSIKILNPLAPHVWHRLTVSRRRWEATGEGARPTDVHPPSSRRSFTAAVETGAPFPTGVDDGHRQHQRDRCCLRGGRTRAPPWLGRLSERTGLEDESAVGRGAAPAPTARAGTHSPASRPPGPLRTAPPAVDRLRRLPGRRGRCRAGTPMTTTRASVMVRRTRGACRTSMNSRMMIRSLTRARTIAATEADGAGAQRRCRPPSRRSPGRST